MLSNYGYADGTGTYYIQIDTDACVECETKACTSACPKGIFEVIEDDWEDEVAAIREDARNQLKTVCASCKSADRTGNELPCAAACGQGAIRHTW